MTDDSGGSVGKDGESKPPIQGERRVRRCRDDFPPHFSLDRITAMPRKTPGPGRGGAVDGKLVQPAWQGML